MGLQARWFANHGQEGARLLCARGERFAQGTIFLERGVFVKRRPLFSAMILPHDKFAITSAS